MYDRALIDERRGFVLWWQPKAACASLKCWFAKLKGFHIMRFNGGPWSVAETQESIHSFIVSQPLFDPVVHSHLYQVAVVRNPFSRIVSQFRTRIRADGTWTGIIDTRETSSGVSCDTFREFVHAIRDTPRQFLEHHLSHYQPGPSVRLDAILSLEHLNFQWPEFQRRIGLPAKPLINRNRSWRTRRIRCCADMPCARLAKEHLRPPWECYYDDAIKRIVARKYREDFLRFGYRASLEDC
jgi:hypothetical protein